MGKKNDASLLTVGELIAAQKTLEYAERVFSDHMLAFGTGEKGCLIVTFREEVMQAAGMDKAVWAVMNAADTINAILHCYPDLSLSDIGFGLKVKMPPL